MENSERHNVIDNAGPSAISAICLRLAEGSENRPTTLFEKNADRLVSPASITKLLTAVTALTICQSKGISIVKELTVLPEDLVEGSGNNLRQEDRLNARHALINLLLASSNISANVIARSFGTILLADCAVAPSASDAQGRFIDEMNSIAARLQMSSSRFLNAHGLAVKGQRSTARDLSRLVLECLRHSMICGVWGLEKYGIQINGPNPRRLIVRSIFLNSSRKAVPDFSIPQFRGGKSGSLWPSVFNLAAVSTLENGNSIISVTLGSPTLIDRHQDYLLMLKIGNDEASY
jgi:serine-type D-Ala-D-Ala carboxypeptidase (penicillin-binding protein 5/6)